MKKFTAEITFQEENNIWTETHLLSTNRAYPTIETVVNEGIIQGDWMIVSRKSNWASVIGAKAE